MVEEYSEGDVMYCNIHGTYFETKANVCSSCCDEWQSVDPEDIPDGAEIEQG